MRASDWEFKNRATLFGLIFGLPYPLYMVDHRNSTAALSNWLSAWLRMDADAAAKLLFAGAALLLVIAVLVRTWASAYLRASVVYAAEVKTASLVADGPYRHVRNPLYFANMLMVIGMGAMMSRVGFVVAFVAMIVFCYRLIRREEANLRASQGESYAAYLKAVPRLLPSPWPRIASAGSYARWADGFRAESWCWGFAAALAIFALTLKTKVFLDVLTASMLVLWVSSSVIQKRSNARCEK
jgi:protein-S-isoprenylcysteine O-methyltransferase Ste14